MTSLLGSVSPSKLIGMAYGLMFFFAFGLGSVSTLIAGFIADNYNLIAVFWITTLFSSMALIISILILKILERKL